MLVEADHKFFERNYDEFVHLQYLSEIMKLVPDDAQREHIKHCRFNGILYFE